MSGIYSAVAPGVLLPEPSEAEDGGAGPSSSSAAAGADADGPPQSAAQKKLAELKARLATARTQNHKEVVAEDRRNKLGPEALAQEAKKRRYEAAKEAGTAATAEDKMMGTTAEAAEAAAGRKSKKERHSFEAGWDVYNNEAQYRHYKKRVRKAGEAGRLDTAAEDDGETPDVLSYGQAAAVPTDRVEAMVGDLHDAALRNASYSRRRTFHEEADVTYINKRNEVFNKKIGRAFDGYTAEIKQNLERGTAL